MSGLSNLYAAAAHGVQQHVSAFVRSDSDNDEDEDEHHVHDNILHNTGNNNNGKKGNYTRHDRRNEQTGDRFKYNVPYHTNTLPTLSSKIVIADDVFFVLRIAMHRALNMHSTQITSAVMMAVNEVIHHDLVDYITLHINQ